MENPMSYSDNLETLVALVTHLAMTKFRSRTPGNLAKYLGLKEAKVLDVLETFKGLFRKSITKLDDGQHYYTLQLRYARRWLQEDDKRHVDYDSETDEPDPREPLEPEHLSALLSFITDMVEQEQATKRQKSSNRAALAGAWTAAAIAFVAAVISLLGVVVDLIAAFAG